MAPRIFFPTTTTTTSASSTSVTNVEVSGTDTMYRWAIYKATPTVSFDSSFSPHNLRDIGQCAPALWVNWGSVTDIMQPSSGGFFCNIREETLSLLGPRTYTVALHRGMRKMNQRSCRPIFGQRGMACQALLRLVTIDQGPTCLNEPASSFFFSTDEWTMERTTRPFLHRN